MPKPKNDDVPPTEFGVFRRPSDDLQVVATTVDDANRYRFDGWEEVAPAAPENDWSAAALADQEAADTAASEQNADSGVNPQ